MSVRVLVARWGRPRIHEVVHHTRVDWKECEYVLPYDSTDISADASGRIGTNLDTGYSRWIWE